MALAAVAGCREKTSRDSSDIAWSYYEHGWNLQRHLYLIRAQESYENAERHLSADDYKLRFRLYLRKGEIYRFYKMQDKEQKMLDSAAQLAVSNNDSSMISYIYYIRAKRQKEMMNYDKAINMFRHSLRFTDRSNDTTLAQIVLEMGKTYARKGAYDTSLTYLRMADSLCEHSNSYVTATYNAAQGALMQIDSSMYYFDRLIPHLSTSERAIAYRMAYEKCRESGRNTLAMKYGGMYILTKDTVDTDVNNELTEKVRNIREYQTQRQKLETTKSELYKNKIITHRLIMGIVLSIIIFTIGYLNTKWRKDKLELRLLNTKLEYMREKREKENAEMAQLQQKFDYYKRLNEMTLPLLMKNRNEMGAFHMKESDWQTIRDNTDSCFDTFTKRLHKDYPQLTDEEINFCCLVKMELSISLLSEIYHIAKGSISRKKMRLKEKMGITEVTFDQFINKY